MITRVVVVGLDGASWNVLEPLIKDGKLPAFKKLLDDGSYGPLESIMPPVSIPAWKCYSTGKKPGALGIYNLLKLDFNMRKLVAPSSRDFKSLEIWDYVGASGSNSCIYGMFGTHPAKEVKGCVISDIPNERGFYPAELKAEIGGRFGDLNTELRYTSERESTYRKALDNAKRDFDVLLYLIEKYKPAFTHISISCTDGIQHFFWGDMEKGAPKFGEFIEKAWIEIDGLLADFLKRLEEQIGKDFYLFIISDHGFEAVKHRFNIGSWLVEKGYLKLNSKGKSLKRALFLRQQAQFIYPVIDSITNFTRAVLGKKGERRGVRDMLVAASVYEKTIDWENSDVIPLTGECLYLNKGKTRSPVDSANIISELRLVNNPDGAPMAKSVVNGKEFYGTDSAPDIIILPRNTEVYNAPLIRVLWSKPAPDRWTGRHSLYGVLMIKGPGVKKSHKIEWATLYDIAPTVLSILGISQTGLDGKILEDAFATDMCQTLREINIGKA